jgi:hypothetical protein
MTWKTEKILLTDSCASVCGAFGLGFVYFLACGRIMVLSIVLTVLFILVGYYLARAISLHSYISSWLASSEVLV